MAAQSSQSFKGFPAGKTSSVQVPTLFFSELLPQIDDLAELKLTVYCFWALQQREGKYRYIRLRDMLDDRLLLAGLGDGTISAEQALQAALDSAVARGTLLHVVVPQIEDHLYFMNTEKGRAAVEALEHGDWRPGPHSSPIALIAERPNIFVLYEQNIGPLTPMLGDILRDAENTYPADWVAEAMKIAVESNKRNWRYVEAILRRWTTEGKTSRSQTSDVSNQNPYLQDEYFRRHEGE
ncbi:MAG: DnaD domain protein [Chloroflexota bacterium]